MVTVAIPLVVAETEHIQWRIARILEGELHEAGRIAHGKVAKQQRINEAEDAGVGADRKGQRQQDDGGEARAAAERAQAVAHVLNQVRQHVQAALIRSLLHRLRDQQDVTDESNECGFQIAHAAFYCPTRGEEREAVNRHGVSFHGVTRIASPPRS